VRTQLPLPRGFATDVGRCRCEDRLPAHARVGGICCWLQTYHRPSTSSHSPLDLALSESAVDSPLSITMPDSWCTIPTQLPSGVNRSVLYHDTETATELLQGWCVRNQELAACCG
jgi:hypothetical protein